MKKFIRAATEQAPKGPELENIDLANTIIDQINGEWDTIRDYNDLIETLKEDKKYAKFISVIDDINNEEHKHIGQLQELLKQISPNTLSIALGETEGDEQLKG